MISKRVRKLQNERALQRNLTVKVEAFDILMTEQKNKARDTNKFSNIVENEDWKKISEITNIMERDKYFSADEAIKFGLIDKVVKGRK